MKKVLIFFAIIFIITAILSFIVTFSKKVVPGEKVALINVTGVILDSSGAVEELKTHTKDNSIKAIVLRVDSPGGAVAPSQEIYKEVLKAREKKKVVVSMGSVAASGGYYISAPADRIVANAGTLTGSIGVIMEIPNVKGLMEKIGIEAQVIKSGKHKDLASVFKSLKPEEKEILQTVLDDVHDQFIQAVSDGRGMDVEETRKIADGRIFTGRMAMKAGLVDELGSLEDAIALAGKLSGIKGEPEVVRKKEKFSLLEILRNQIPVKFMGDTFSGVSLKYLFTL
ncbi:MAG: signal peptide peptidase SppA [Nitrospiraceae bacterium]|nr:MAG: signal peptide peptidase SppA [Nitrospiraceae bacterium]